MPSSADHDQAMAFKWLVTDSRPLYHGGVRDVLLPKPLSRGRRLFHQTAELPSRRFERGWHHNHQRHLEDAKPLFTVAQAGRFARSPRTHVFFGGCAIAAAIFYVANLEFVPVSGRRRFNCYGDGVSTLSDQQVKRVIYETEKHGLRILPEYDLRYGDSYISRPAVNNPPGLSW